MFVLIQLFKITSIRHSKSKRLGIILEKINKFMLKNKRPKILVKSNEKQFGKKSFLLPWWFKFVLYLISFSFMALSITFVILKGKRYMFFFIIYFIIIFIMNILGKKLLIQFGNLQNTTSRFSKN